ncbi:hypothetical protein Poly41_41310 [Novipirellula artificiosorum]|uniref:Uncharacterized protein n=1 Tax=Novipirellula artificiosorum TaxID=2528016 RepID=A0A5C6DGN8_9BACT|nr:hypothetical protein Poly41_41310 [Novipirellula artificiosorum]
MREGAFIDQGADDDVILCIVCFAGPALRFASVASLRGPSVKIVTVGALKTAGLIARPVETSNARCGTSIVVAVTNAHASDSTPIPRP